jgi:hypothetical protein
MSFTDDERHDLSTRAHRLLVRVLLCLRGEARRSDNPLADEVRVQLLADRIMREIPRRVIPVGIAALVVVGAFCATPLVRDAIEHRDAAGARATVASVLEQGIRERGQTMSDGLSELRQAVAPLSGPGGTPPVAEEQADAVVEEAEFDQLAIAPFKKS